MGNIFLVLLWSASGPLPHSRLPGLFFLGIVAQAYLPPGTTACPRDHLCVPLSSHSPLPALMALSKNWDHMHNVCNCCCLPASPEDQISPSTLLLLSGTPLSPWGALQMTTTGTAGPEGGPSNHPLKSRVGTRDVLISKAELKAAMRFHGSVSVVLGFRHRTS